MENKMTPKQALEDLKIACQTHMGTLVYILQEDKFEIIEQEFKTNQKKLDLIGEILVDVSKGNYADLNDAIKDIREVLL